MDGVRVDMFCMIVDLPSSVKSAAVWLIASQKWQQTSFWEALHLSFSCVCKSNILALFAFEYDSVLFPCPHRSEFSLREGGIQFSPRSAKLLLTSSCLFRWKIFLLARANECLIVSYFVVASSPTFVHTRSANPVLFCCHDGFNLSYRSMSYQRSILHACIVFLSSFHRSIFLVTSARRVPNKCPNQVRSKSGTFTRQCLI